MEIFLQRMKDNTDSTIGAMYINGELECFTLEDTYHETKIPGETRIPEGTYEIKLRNEGGMTKKYASRYPFHKGMLHLQNVDNFKWVYIHTGNNEDHTEGCILVGNSVSCTPGAQHVGASVLAYKRIYPKIAKAIEKGETVTIEVK